MHIDRDCATSHPPIQKGEEKEALSRHWSIAILKLSEQTVRGAPDLDVCGRPLLDWAEVLPSGGASSSSVSHGSWLCSLDFPHFLLSSLAVSEMGVGEYFLGMTQVSQSTHFPQRVRGLKIVERIRLPGPLAVQLC